MDASGLPIAMSNVSSRVVWHHFLVYREIPRSLHRRSFRSVYLLPQHLALGISTLRNLFHNLHVVYLLEQHFLEICNLTMPTTDTFASSRSIETPFMIAVSTPTYHAPFAAPY